MPPDKNKNVLKDDLDRLNYGGLSSFMSCLNVPITENFSLELSTAIASDNAHGIGANATANLSVGSFNASYGFSASYFTKAHGTGKPGFETRSSYSGGITMRDFALRGYSTSFSSGKTTQKVSGIGGQMGDFGFRYENDAGGVAFLGDGNDSYRTAAVQLSYKDVVAGFNLFTGLRNQDSYNSEGGRILNANNLKALGLIKTGYFGERYPNGVIEEFGHPYRLGAAYIGYRGLKYGIDSDRHIRHPIQNQFAHGFAKPQPFFKSYSDAILPYYQYQTANKFTLW
ncbi:polymorphic toxin type 23 domain-containing protein [Muricauda sp. SCSIO 64092]|uniref:polymorphic toxin type 23 domain-containing protein n=1 Tax=Allomuricauda sp. SCSIO 64092 TaxID=2908842 RepID=UPI001FF15644|nr:polymorphic toxin type 23 domain-containing protein [Muricauda sp. SCSIO 64092]UOY08653.1 polymorphic toxin type 23 domain-containing protein [Muricauda sp. SCSIO 64092]